MTAWLGGGAVGVIGLLVGAVLALWYRSRVRALEGEVALCELRLLFSQKAHEQAVAAALAAEEARQEEEARDELRIARLKKELSEARSKQFGDMSAADLAAYATRMYENEVADTGRTPPSSGTVSHGTASDIITGDLE